MKMFLSVHMDADLHRKTFIHTIDIKQPIKEEKLSLQPTTLRQPI